MSLMAAAVRARVWLSRPWDQRVAQARRDLATLVGGASAAPKRFAKTSGAGARRMRVAEVVRETADAVTLVLEGDLKDWQAGEFLTLGVRIDGVVERRAYSLCVPPGAAAPAITVKRVAGGKVSNWLVAHAAVGLDVEVGGPSGRFVFTPQATPRTIVLVGGGSGITPLIAIAEHALRHEPQSRVVLIYGNRSPADVIFAARIAEHAASLGARFQLVSVFGLLDVAALGPLLERTGAGAEYWLCGPEPMMAAAREVLGTMKVAAIHEERFLALGRADQRMLPTASQPLRVRTRGGVRETQVRPGQTLLEAGLLARAPMPSSCTLGGCGACRVRLKSGEVLHQTPNCLTADEAADGWVLACVARPLTAVELEVDA